ncbi:GIDE domain-containing protein [Natrialbaceae archaeon A-arb3/5]
MESTLFALLFAGGGIVALGYGGLQLRKWRRIRAGEPVPIREAVIESDPVEIEGRIEPYEETLTSPILTEECVAYEYEVEEKKRRRGRKGRNKTTWKTVDSGSARRPFVLEDETGTAHVDPSSASLSMGTERTNSIDDESSLPPGLQSTSSGPLSISIGGFNLGGNQMRYTEKRLDVGEDGYVFGQSESNPHWADVDIALSDGPETPMFLVSDTGEAGTMRRFLQYGLGGVGAGTVAFVIATLLFL